MMHHPHALLFPAGAEFRSGHGWIAGAAGRRTRWLNCLAAVLLLMAVPSAMACKYSVRDLAFVDVHPSPWQLIAVAPPDIGTQQRETWRSIIDRTLEDTNLSPVWTTDPKTISQFVTPYFQNATFDQPGLVLLGPGDQSFPINASDAGGNWEQELGRVVQSPTRLEILDRVTQALCVLLVIEGAGGRSEIREIAESAARKSAQQLWMLDKAPEHGPQVVMLPWEERVRERWLLQSLGIVPESVEGAVAVIYGQARCLGEPLVEQDVTEDKLVRMAAVCGRDCECDLDKSWLYGTQLLHAWNRNLELAAERSLDFDPRSAMVIAESYQILRRNGSAHRTTVLPDAGGLVIHELPDLPPGNTPDHGDSGRDTEVHVEETRPDRETGRRIDSFRVAGMIGAGLILVIAVSGMVIFRRDR